MVLALAALAAAAASFPTGFGFGAGYGAGVRIGYDVIYPKLAPFAAKITDDILGSVDKLFGSGSGIAARSSGKSGFSFSQQEPFPPDSPQIQQPERIATEGRREGATELKETVKQAIDTVTSPVTRVQLVHFKNYKTSTERINVLVGKIRTASTSNFTAKRTWQDELNRLQPLKERSRRIIQGSNWWPRYYNWLKTFT